MIIVLSIDNRDSFNNLKMWVNSVEKNTVENKIPLVVMCNKCDLEDKRQVKNEEVKLVCKNDLNLKVFFSSAKLGSNIDESFDFIIKEVIKTYTVTPRISYGKQIKEKEESDKKAIQGGCCN